MPMSWVNDELTYLGLYMHKKGNMSSSSSALATRQTIEAGTQVEVGTVIGVQFADNSVRDR